MQRYPEVTLKEINATSSTEHFILFQDLFLQIMPLFFSQKSSL